jgi:hypothetical protein
LGFEVERAYGGFEKLAVEFLLLDDACDVAKVSLVSAFPIGLEFVEDDVFGRSDCDLTVGCGDPAGMGERPVEAGMIP